MNRDFDLIVIGTGAAGSAAAHKCRQAGWEVAIIDSRPYGGTCALRGCDPKKVLVRAAELIGWNRRMQGKGVSVGSTEIDWSSLMRFKRTFTEPVPQNMEKSYAKAGIVPYHGRTRFVDRTTVQGGDDKLAGRFVQNRSFSSVAAISLSSSLKLPRVLARKSESSSVVDFNGD